MTTYCWVIVSVGQSLFLQFFEYVNHTLQVRCLNEERSGSILKCFKPRATRMDRTDACISSHASPQLTPLQYTDSDADEQLIVYIPYVLLIIASHSSDHSEQSLFIIRQD